MKQKGFIASKHPKGADIKTDDKLGASMKQNVSFRFISALRQVNPYGREFSFPADDANQT